MLDGYDYNVIEPDYCIEVEKTVKENARTLPRYWENVRNRDAAKVLHFIDKHS